MDPLLLMHICLKVKGQTLNKSSNAPQELIMCRHPKQPLPPSQPALPRPCPRRSEHHQHPSPPDRPSSHRNRPRRPPHQPLHHHHPLLRPRDAQSSTPAPARQLHSRRNPQRPHSSQARLHRLPRQPSPIHHRTRRARRAPSAVNNPTDLICLDWMIWTSNLS